MVSGIFKVKDLLKMKKLPPGIYRKGGRIFYRTLHGNIMQAKPTGELWHRGKGRWSQTNRILDEMKRAKTVSERRHSKHPHVGDLKGQRW